MPMEPLTPVTGPAPSSTTARVVTSVSTPSASSSSSSAPPRRILSCTRCQYRKIRCPRTFPCAPCIQAGAQCVQATRAPNRPRPSHQHELKRHLDRCEQLLQEVAGSRSRVPERPSSSSSSVNPSPVLEPTVNSVAQHGSIVVKDVEDALSGWTPFRRPDGKLVEHSDGTVSFMEDGYLQSVHEEVRAMREILDNDSTNVGVASVGTGNSYSPVATNTPPSTAEDLDTDMGLLGNDEMATSYPTAHLWPTSAHVFRLWQIYIDRVNPLSKVIHVPSLQPYLVEACVGIDNLPRNIQGLLFSIFLMAIVAMREGETQEYLGISRDQAFARFSSGTRRTLRNQDFSCKNDLVIIQTLAVYTMSLHDRPRSQRSAAWILSGVALRMAQRMGLHQDGERLGLSPFETEMRRRLWWQLVLQDAHFALGAGLGHSLIPRDSNTLGPRNLNDADIYPAATEPFQDREGPTEMVLCRILYHLARFMTRTPGLEMGMTVVDDHPSAATTKEFSCYEATNHGGDGGDKDHHHHHHQPSSAAYQQHNNYYSALLHELERDVKHIRDNECNPTNSPAHRMAAVLIDCLLKHLNDTFRRPPPPPPAQSSSSSSSSSQQQQQQQPCNNNFRSSAASPFNPAGDSSPDSIFRTAVSEMEMQNKITAISLEIDGGLLFSWFSRLDSRVTFESTLYVVRQLQKKNNKGVEEEEEKEEEKEAWKQIEDMYGIQEGLFDFTTTTTTTTNAAAAAANRVLAREVLEAWRVRSSSNRRRREEEEVVVVQQGQGEEEEEEEGSTTTAAADPSRPPPPPPTPYYIQRLMQGLSAIGDWGDHCGVGDDDSHHLGTMGEQQQEGGMTTTTTTTTEPMVFAHHQHHHYDNLLFPKTTSTESSSTPAETMVMDGMDHHHHHHHHHHGFANGCGMMPMPNQQQMTAGQFGSSSSSSSIMGFGMFPPTEWS